MRPMSRWRHSIKKDHENLWILRDEGFIESQLLMTPQSGTFFPPILTLEIVSCQSAPLPPWLNWKRLKTRELLSEFWHITVTTSEKMDSMKDLMFTPPALGLHPASKISGCVWGVSDICHLGCYLLSSKEVPLGQKGSCLSFHGANQGL